MGAVCLGIAATAWALAPESPKPDPTLRAARLACRDATPKLVDTNFRLFSHGAPRAGAEYHCGYTNAATGEERWFVVSARRDVPPVACEAGFSNCPH